MRSVGRLRKAINPIIKIISLFARLRPIRKLPEFVFVLSYLFRSSNLHFAAYFGNLPSLDLFISHGADIHSTANPKGMTPLILAAETTGQACGWVQSTGIAGQA